MQMYLALSILVQNQGIFTARRSLVEAHIALDSMAPSKKGKEDKEVSLGEAVRVLCW